MESHPFSLINRVELFLTSLTRSAISIAGFKTNECVHMIGDIVDNDGFLVFLTDDARHVFENILTPFRLQKVVSPFDGGYGLDVNLGVCSFHGCGFSANGKHLLNRVDMVP